MNMCDTRTEAVMGRDTRTEAALARLEEGVGVELGMRSMGKVHPGYFDMGKTFLIRTAQLRHCKSGEHIKKTL